MNKKTLVAMIAVTTLGLVATVSKEKVTCADENDDKIANLIKVIDQEQDKTLTFKANSTKKEQGQRASIKDEADVQKFMNRDEFKKESASIDDPQIQKFMNAFKKDEPTKANEDSAKIWKSETTTSEKGKGITFKDSIFQKFIKCFEASK